MPTQRRIRWAKFRVATLAIVALIILGVLFYLLTGGTVLRTKATLYLYVPDSTGLDVDSPVRVDGIDIGKVTGVRLSGSSEPSHVVRVTMAVGAGDLAHLPVDSYAQLSADSFLGDQFVDITSGKSAQYMQPGAVLSYQEQTSMMKNLDLEQFQAQLRVIDGTLRDIEEGRNRLGQFVNQEGMYNDLRHRLIKIQNSFKAVRQTTQGIGQVLFTDQMHRSVAQTMLDLDRRLALIQAGPMMKSDTQYESLRKQAGDIRTSIQKMRSSDFFASDEMYVRWNRNLAGIIDGVDALNAGPLMATSATYDNLNGAARELGAQLKDFAENPKKYLRLKVF